MPGKVAEKMAEKDGRKGGGKDGGERLRGKMDEKDGGEI